MTYPKPVMTTSELIEMGFTKYYLDAMAHIRGQTYATKVPGGKKLYWDTKKFERERIKYAAR